MYESGDYIVPKTTQNKPFLAKPPLTFWLSAFSFKILGLNEFAARLPHFLLSVLTVFFVWYAIRKFDKKLAFLTALIHSSSLIGFVCAGAVMTEASVLFCLSLMQIGFFMSISGYKSYRFLPFIGAGLGMLAKGPFVLVIGGLPIFLWVLYQNKWRDLWDKLPIIWGFLIFNAIYLPWYTAIQLREPIFLKYFILGEHFGRFFYKGWSGDMYGYAHLKPLGFIWVYFVIGIIPWGFVWLFGLCKKFWKIKCETNKNLLVFSLFCTLAPLVFFSFARNIILPYPAVVIIHFSILTAAVIRKINLKDKTLTILSLVMPLIFALGSCLFIFGLATKIKGVDSYKPLQQYLQAKELDHEQIAFVDIGFQFNQNIYLKNRYIMLSCDELRNMSNGYFILGKQSKCDVEKRIPNGTKIILKFPKYILYKKFIIKLDADKYTHKYTPYLYKPSLLSDFNVQNGVLTNLKRQ
jgi:4-amino-4-deoxy-L-arabinose transferase-like glycosyltransferase